MAKLLGGTTVYGLLSAAGTVYASGGNSDLWNSNYTAFTANSANWNNSYTTLTANSANWNNSYTTLTANSANWNSTYTTTNTTSGNWNVGGNMPIALTGSVNFNGIKAGQQFSINTPLSTFIMRLVAAAIQPTYLYPTLSCTTPSSAYEVGTTLTFILTSLWTQNNAGSATQFIILSSYTGSSYNTVTSSSVIGNLTAYQLTNYVLLSTTSFETSAVFTTGARLFDSYGDPSISPPIQPNALSSNVITVTAYRNSFYSADTRTSASLSSSNEVRALTGIRQVNNNDSFNINVPSGATRLVIVYPFNYALTLFNPSTVNITPSAYNSSTSVFTTSSLFVSGVNGYSPISYRTFIYNGAPPAGSYTISTSQPVSTNPTYTTPTVTISAPYTTISNEVGATLSANTAYIFAPGDGGAYTNLQILTSSDNSAYTSVTALATPPTTAYYTTNPFILSSNNTSIYIIASAGYGAGIRKFSNYSDLYGGVPAGSASNSYTLNLQPYRNAFYTADNGTLPVNTSPLVRALTPHKVSNYDYYDVVAYNITRFVIAYPNDYAIQVNYNGTTNLINQYSNYFTTNSSVSVSGAPPSNLYPTNYRVYTYNTGTYGNPNGVYFITVSQPGSVSPPPYTPPTASLSPSSQTIGNEIGSTTGIGYTLTYNQNAAGTATNYYLLTSIDNINYTQAASTAGTSYTLYFNSSANDSSGTFNDSTYYVKLSTTYNAGPQGYTNFGDLYGSPLPMSAVASSPATVTSQPYRNLFYWHDTTPNVPVASDVRTYGTPLESVDYLGNVYNNTFNINVLQGDRRVVFAYPAYLGDTNVSVNDVVHNITYTFTKTQLIVYGANGLAPVLYNVFYYIPAATGGFSSNVTLTVVYH